MAAPITTSPKRSLQSSRQMRTEFDRLQTYFAWSSISQHFFWIYLKCTVPRRKTSFVLRFALNKERRFQSILPSHTCTYDVTVVMVVWIKHSPFIMVFSWRFIYGISFINAWFYKRSALEIAHEKSLMNFSHVVILQFYTFKGYCTSLTKISMFCTLSQNYQHLFGKMIYTSYCKLSKKLKNSIKIQIGQLVLDLLIQTPFWLFWSITLKIIWPTKMSMAFLNFLDNLLSDAYIFFFKRVLLILR